MQLIQHKTKQWKQLMQLKQLKQTHSSQWNWFDQFLMWETTQFPRRPWYIDKGGLDNL